jgi:hypothetical protein
MADLGATSISRRVAVARGLCTAFDRACHEPCRDPYRLDSVIEYTLIESTSWLRHAGFTLADFKGDDRNAVMLPQSLKRKAQNRQTRLGSAYNSTHQCLLEPLLVKWGCCNSHRRGWAVAQPCDAASLN